MFRPWQWGWNLGFIVFKWPGGILWLRAVTQPFHLLHLNRYWARFKHHEDLSLEAQTFKQLNKCSFLVDWDHWNIVPILICNLYKGALHFKLLEGPSSCHKLKLSIYIDNLNRNHTASLHRIFGLAWTQWFWGVHPKVLKYFYGPC